MCIRDRYYPIQIIITWKVCHVWKIKLYSSQSWKYSLTRSSLHNSSAIFINFQTPFFMAIPHLHDIPYCKLKMVASTWLYIITHSVTTPCMCTLCMLVQPFVLYKHASKVISTLRTSKCCFGIFGIEITRFLIYLKWSQHCTSTENWFGIGIISCTDIKSCIRPQETQYM